MFRQLFFFGVLYVNIFCLGFLRLNICCQRQMYTQVNGINRKSSNSNRNKMLQDIIEKVDFKRIDRPSPTLPALDQDPIFPLVTAAIMAGSSRKAQAISAIRITHMTEVTDFMVILEGNSRPQNQAIANTVEEDLLRSFSEQPSKQGDAAGGWILLDYGRLIVHIMTPQMRNFYKLENRWKNAEFVDVDGILGQEALKPSRYEEGLEEVGEEVDNSVEQEDEDPFWK